jgi:hypothetical protein
MTRHLHTTRDTPSNNINPTKASLTRVKVSHIKVKHNHTKVKHNHTKVKQHQHQQRRLSLSVNQSLRRFKIIPFQTEKPREPS